MAERPKLRPGAISDAGPLIHLLEIDVPQALGIFHRVLVPEPVAAELRSRPDGPAAGFLGRGPVRVVTPTPAERVASETYSLRYEVGQVDGAVLAAARGRGVSIVATDDLPLRDAAKVMGLQAVGTLGIVLRAAVTGHVKPGDAEAALNAVLEDSSLFVTRALVDEARTALRRALR